MDLRKCGGVIVDTCKHKHNELHRTICTGTIVAISGYYTKGMTIMEFDTKALVRYLIMSAIVIAFAHSCKPADASDIADRCVYSL